jgi:hypothetical protein
MRIDVNAFLGQYPFRRLPETAPTALLQAMDRTGIDQAWVSHLSAIFWRDPTEGNATLYQAAAHESRLRPIPAVHPELPRWQEGVAEAVDREAPCVRCDPAFYGLHPAGSEMRALARECGRRQIPLLMAVRLEDSRQRHPNDRADTLAPWAVRALIRSDPALRLIITHADRDFVDQVHFGSTPEEARRILWDTCWVWGPPEEHLNQLIHTVGIDRFTFGTGMPMRLPEGAVCKLDLLDPTPDQRRAIESENLQRHCRLTIDS